MIVLRITGFESEQAILKELGDRIKNQRIASNITQTELAKKCGISTSTQIRIENGEDTKFSNILRILSALDLLENLNLLIPEEQPDYKLLYENKKQRERASKARSKEKAVWSWGEDS